MLLSNQPIVTKLDPKITPAIKHGNLYPPEDYGNNELTSMAPKSIYLSCTYKLVDCNTTVSAVSMWLKVGQSGDGCSGVGDCHDWQEFSTGGVFCGQTPPLGMEQEFCCRPIGAWYIQYCSAGECTTDQPYIWLKMTNNCSESDWTLVSPNVAPVFFGDVNPNLAPDAYCQLPVGSVYYQYCPGKDTNACVVISKTTKATNLIRWEKIQGCCDGSDWVDTTATPTVKLDIGVEFDCTLDAIACLPVGAIVYNEDCKLWIKLCPVGSEADPCDNWCFIDNHPPMTVTWEDEKSFDKETQTLVLDPHTPPTAVTCAEEAPTEPNDGDVWINNAGSCDTECCASTFIWASCLGEAGAWKRIWGPEMGATRAFVVVAVSPYLPENEITTFPEERLTYSEPSALPGAYSEEYTFTLKCPAVIDISADVNLSILPIIRFDDNDEPLPLTDDGRTAVTTCIYVDGISLACNGGVANNFSEEKTLNTPTSIRLSCGEHTIQVKHLESHTGTTIGEDENEQPVYDNSRRQQWFVESMYINMNWDERC